MANIVDRSALPEMWPTNLLDGPFAEWLGRAVATFGFLEDHIRRALLALTGTKPTDAQPTEEDLSDWDQYLRRQMANQLGPLIRALDLAVASDPRLDKEDFAVLFDELEGALRMRNLICHACWSKASAPGFYTPRFFNKHLEFCENDIDVEFLKHLQIGTSELIADVTDIVTGLGYQFPGTRGPGQVIYDRKNCS